MPVTGPVPSSEELQAPPKITGKLSLQQFNSFAFKMLQNDEEVEFFVDTLTDFVCRRDLTCAFNVSRVHNYILELIIDLLEVKASYRPETSMKDFYEDCLLYTSPSPRDRTRSRMPSSA